MIIGFFFVRPIPLPEETLNGEDYSSSSTYAQHNSSRTPLLNHENSQISGQDDDEAHNIELSRSLHSQNGETSGPSLSDSTAIALGILPNVHGKQLWCSSDFWLLFGILSIRAFACVSTILVHL